MNPGPFSWTHLNYAQTKPTPLETANKKKKETAGRPDLVHGLEQMDNQAISWFYTSRIWAHIPFLTH